MALPFTATDFLALFTRYNAAIWPAQVVAIMLGVVAVAGALRPARHSSLAISAILAAFWLWNGLVYHLEFFRRINPAAALFGALFIAQGILFLWDGILRPRLTFTIGTGWPAFAGALLVVYASLVYPLLGALFGHPYPQAPMFGVAPCPTTIFTIGLMLWARPPLPGYLIVIPVIWSMIGFSAAILLGIPEDTGLLVAALLGVAQRVHRDHHTTQPGGSRPEYA